MSDRAIGDMIGAASVLVPARARPTSPNFIRMSRSTRMREQRVAVGLDRVDQQVQQRPGFVGREVTDHWPTAQTR